jgi:16S rRNA (uracil1498-N3)-methyltransferase
MRLTRIYVGAPLIPGSVVELPEGTAAHLAKVLRARAGDELVLFNGDGREFAGAIEAVRGARVSASVGDGRPVDRESPIAVTLVQCVPRGDRMDFVVQKATELGVSRIVPVLSQRSVVRLDLRQAETKAVHWRAVAVSACEQCGRNRLPIIDAARPLLSYLGESTAAAGPRLVFEPDSEPARNVAQDSMSDAEIAIGPEGGFASDELEAFRVAGFVRIGLGPRILRTETAAVAALTWLQTRFGDMSIPTSHTSRSTDA